MPSAVTLRTDFSASELRRQAKRSKDNNQSRLLLSLAAVLDGMSRTDAARIGGMGSSDPATRLGYGLRTDRLDAEGMLRVLAAYLRGDHQAWSCRCSSGVR